MKQFKLLRGESSSLENHDTRLTAHTINHFETYSTSSFNEISEERMLELTRAFNGGNNFRNIDIVDQRLFVNDTRIGYKLTLWNRLKTWWKYSMNKEEKLNFCLLIGLLFAIFSMLGYIVYADRIITEQISKMK